jgi:serine/threonine-protein kinase
MGVVYLAQDPLIGRQVAVKAFRVGFNASDDELHGLYARFIREAQSAGILSHPNIVTVHDVAQADGETPAFIAMEYVEGQTLKELLDSPEPIRRERAIDLVAQVARALEYAHSMGVVHRDVKPGNILITPDDKVKITDFGIALVNAANITNGGQVLGTPNYMAPEAIENTEVDHRADLFSLGVVLYELLTRHKPFAGGDMTQVTRRIVYEPFTPVTEYLRDLPAQLETVLSRALEKKPERRFQTAHEIVLALEEEREEEVFPNETARISVVPPPAVSPLDTQNVVLRPDASSAKPRRGLFGWLRKGTPVGNVPYWLLAAGIVAGVSMGYFLSQRDVAAQAAAAPAQEVRLAPTLDELERDRASQLASAARRHLGVGDLDSAAVVLAEAIRLLPESAQLRSEFERVSGQLELERTEWQLQVDEHLAASRRSLADGRVRDSTRFANLALDLDPMSLEAPALLEEGEAALARIRSRRAATPKTQVVEPVVVEEPEVVELVEPEEPVPAPEPLPVATPGVMNLRLETAVSPGVLTLYAGDEQIYRERFRFVEKKKGFLRSLTAKAGAGELASEFQLDPGDLSLRIYVSFTDKPTQTFRLKGELAAGGDRTVVISIDEAGLAQARLE